MRYVMRVSFSGTDELNKDIAKNIQFAKYLQCIVMLFDCTKLCSMLGGLDEPLNHLIFEAAAYIEGKWKTPSTAY